MIVRNNAVKSFCYLLILSILIISCDEKPLPRLGKGSGTKDFSGQSSGSGQDNDPDGSTKPELVFVDPYKIEIRKIRMILEPRVAGSTLGKFPMVEVELDSKTQYYQVMRCPVDVERKLVTSMGYNPLTKEYSEYSLFARDDYKEVWSQVAPRVGCKMVADFGVGKKFHDITASSGSFFYLVKPCVVQESTIRSDRCHYKYYKTNAMEWLNPVALENQELLQRLHGERAAATRKLLQMSDLILAAMNYLEICEYNEIQKIVAKRQKAGWIKVLATAVVGVVAGYFGGPLVGFKAAEATLSLADKLFSKYSDAQVNCPKADPLFDEYFALREEIDPHLTAAKEIRTQLGELKAEDKGEAVDSGVGVDITAENPTWDDYVDVVERLNQTVGESTDDSQMRNNP